MMHGLLPDSAVIGTAKRVKGVSKGRRRSNKGLLDDLAYLGRPRVKSRAKADMLRAKNDFRAEWAKALGRA